MIAPSQDLQQRQIDDGDDMRDDNEQDAVGDIEREGETDIRNLISLDNEKKMAAFVFYYNSLSLHMKNRIRDVSFVNSAKSEFLIVVKSDRRTLEWKLRIFRFIDSTKFKPSEAVLKLYITKLLELLRYQPRENVRLGRDEEMRSQMGMDASPPPGNGGRVLPWRRGRPRKRSLPPPPPSPPGDGDAWDDDGDTPGPRPRRFPPPPPPDFPTSGGRRLGGFRRLGPHSAGFPLMPGDGDEPPSPSVSGGARGRDVFRMRERPMTPTMPPPPPPGPGAGAVRRGRTTLSRGGIAPLITSYVPPPPRPPPSPVSIPLPMEEEETADPLLAQRGDVPSGVPSAAEVDRRIAAMTATGARIAEEMMTTKNALFDEVQALRESYYSSANNLVLRMKEDFSEMLEAEKQIFYKERRQHTPYIPHNTIVTEALPNINIFGAPQITRERKQWGVPSPLTLPSERAQTPIAKTSVSSVGTSPIPRFKAPSTEVGTSTMRRARMAEMATSPMPRSKTPMRTMATSPMPRSKTPQRSMATSPMPRVKTPTIPRVKTTEMATSPPPSRAATTIEKGTSPRTPSPIEMTPATAEEEEEEMAAELAVYLNPARYIVSAPEVAMLPGPPHQILDFLPAIVGADESIRDMPEITRPLAILPRQSAFMPLEPRALMPPPPPPGPIIEHPKTPPPVIALPAPPAKKATSQLPVESVPMVTEQSTLKPRLPPGARPKQKVAATGGVKTRSHTLREQPVATRTRVRSGIVLKAPTRLQPTFTTRPVTRRKKKKITSAATAPLAEWLNEDETDKGKVRNDLTTASKLIDSTRTASGATSASKSINHARADVLKLAPRNKQKLLKKAHRVKETRENTRRNLRLRLRSEAAAEKITRASLNAPEEGDTSRVIPLATLRVEDLANDITYNNTVAAEPLVAPVLENGTHDTLTGVNERVTTSLHQINRNVRMIAENTSRATRALRADSMSSTDRLVSSRTELAECAETILARREAYVPVDDTAELSASAAVDDSIRSSAVIVRPPNVLENAVANYIGLSTSSSASPTEYNTFRQPTAIDRSLAESLTTINNVNLEDVPANSQQYAEQISASARSNRAIPHPEVLITDILLRLRNTVNDMKLLSSDPEVARRYRAEADRIIEQVNDFLEVAHQGLTAAVKASVLEEGEDERDLGPSREEYEQRLYVIAQQAVDSRDGLVRSLRESGVSNLNYIGELTEMDADFMGAVADAEHEYLYRIQSPGETFNTKGLEEAENGSYTHIAHLARQLRRSEIINGTSRDEILNAYIRLSSGLSRTIMNLVDVNEDDSTPSLLQRYSELGGEYIFASREFLITNNVLQNAFRGENTLSDSLLNLQRTHLTSRQQILSLFNSTQIIFANSSNAAQLSLQNGLITEDELSTAAYDIIEASSGNLNAETSTPNTENLLGNLAGELSATGMASADEDTGIINGIVPANEALNAESEVAHVETQAAATAIENTLSHSEHTGESLVPDIEPTTLTGPGAEEDPSFAAGAVELEISDIPTLTETPSSTQQILALTASDPEAEMRVTTKRKRLVTGESRQPARVRPKVSKRFAIEENVSGEEQLSSSKKHVSRMPNIAQREEVPLPRTAVSNNPAVPTYEPLPTHYGEHHPMQVIENFCGTPARRSSRLRQSQINYVNQFFNNIARGKPSSSVPDLIAARNFMYAIYMQSNGRLQRQTTSNVFKLNNMKLNMDDLITNNYVTLTTNTLCQNVLDTIKRNHANTDGLQQILPLIAGSEYIQHELGSTIDMHMAEVPRDVTDVSHLNDSIESIDLYNPLQSPPAEETTGREDEPVEDYTGAEPLGEEEEEEFYDASDRTNEVDEDDMIPDEQTGQGLRTHRNTRHISHKQTQRISKRHKAARARVASRVNLLAKRQSGANFSYKLFMKYLAKSINANSRTIHDTPNGDRQVGHGLMHNRGRLITPHHYTRTYGTLFSYL